METKSGKNRTVGHLKTMRLDITSPMKMNTDMDFNELTILTGRNGTGKTLFLIMSWAMGIISDIILKQKDHPQFHKSAAQTVLDHSFSDQNINGSIGGDFERGSVDITLEEGKVTSVKTSYDEEVDTPTAPVFMSSGMRLFNSVSLYLKTRKLLGASRDSLGNIMPKMLESYRLYDIMLVEGMIFRCPIKTSDGFKKAMKDFEINPPIESIECDLEKCSFIAVMEDGSKKPLEKFSSGEQAAINMFLNASS